MPPTSLHDTDGDPLDDGRRQRDPGGGADAIIGLRGLRTVGHEIPMSWRGPATLRP